MLHRLLPFVWVLIFASFLPAPAGRGQEWTRFRGPNGTGVSPSGSIPAEWTESTIQWKAPLPGVGHASPVVWDDRIFLLSADADSATRYVICLSTIDGRPLWQRDFPSESHHLHVRNSFASTTPAVDESQVYVAWSTPAQTTLMALDHAGQLIWERDLGPFASQHGFGTSPMLFEDLVILCVQQRKPEEDGPQTETSFVIAVDRSSGQTRWQTPRRSEVVSYSTPCLYERPGHPAELIVLQYGSRSVQPESTGWTGKLVRPGTGDAHGQFPGRRG